MTVRRPTYRVELDDGSEHVVQVLHGDQLRAELEAKQQHIPVDPGEAPLHTTTLWIWASMKRTGAVKGDYQTFQNTTLVASARVSDEDIEQLQLEQVGPTQQAQPTEQG